MIDGTILIGVYTDIIPINCLVSIYHLSLSILFRIFVLCMQCFYAYKLKVCFENQYLQFYFQRNQPIIVIHLYLLLDLSRNIQIHFCTLTLNHIIYNTHSWHTNYWANSVLHITGLAKVGDYFTIILLKTPYSHQKVKFSSPCQSLQVYLFTNNHTYSPIFM